ncbi:UNVERIFIED_CONTAM: Retrovirus-related Pol polyprotein from type-1 retrotransposable element R2 [Sesamum radiatum]|uniref:Retrovirus-related Pol polyprotein from type-1 retrotransposable element R2 n=1 Tax=Sesamum radiatum TaxID=300843 RepID=A0AAW2MEL3_SESRA
MKDVTDEFVSYFQTLLGGTRVQRDIDLNFLQSDLKYCLTIEEADTICAPITLTEINDATFDIDEDNAPGPDGYTSGFFKASWSVVGNDISAAVGEFFTTGRLLKQVNATLLVLIPKVQIPSQVSDFRPISCCNVIYKIISKIIVKRMQRVLHLLIDYSQNAFIPGRNISDNILLAQELLAGYNEAKLPPRCTIKIDLQKAYDSMEWDFLIEVLKLYKFPARFIGWIEQCVTTASFSVSLNGSIYGFFPGKRGLRQGDPLSPYLFVLVMQTWHSLFQYRVHNAPQFQFHWKCKEQRILNLCFADDVLLFCKADLPSIQVIKDSLQEFAALSGLQVNPNKSQIILSRAGQQGSTGRGYAKVAWEQVCRQKEEGGLGFRNILVMNQALMLKHLWKLIQNDRNSIWADWIIKHRLHKKTLWTFHGSIGSWGWKKMIKLRPFFQRGLQYKVGDGLYFQLWQDIWHERGPLCVSYPQGPNVTGLPIDTLLSRVMRHGQWNWPT